MQYGTGTGSGVKHPGYRESASGGAGVNRPGAVFAGMLCCLVLLCACNRALADTAANTVESYLQASRAAGKTANRLINEVSPYLLQHAYNPVQWYAWGDEAFERAKKENKPIFLSIGYSTCHWCHVMAHESFENKAIASILNEHYISIKLDREERPDIDAVYMAATTLLNGYGGWPMTVFINHELEPFHAGVYYPPESSGGRQGLKELLIEVQRLWQQERKRIENVADNISGIIAAAGDKTGPAENLDGDIYKRALEQIELSYDKEHGGFGNAPKFPHHGIFSFLLSQSRQQQDGGNVATKMISTTLTAMAQGGIFDQIGGGFHRYSVDAEWQLPHFEKMLYSQALLATAYTRLYALEKKPLYKHVAQLTLDFVLREMQSGGGGFYSALDADSERPDRPREYAEGAYYLWSEKELAKLLTAEEYEFATVYYAVEKEGNIASDPRDEFTGLNILRLSEPYREIPVTQKQQAMLDRINTKLFRHRQLRSRPQLDDKIITEWNGMMITALVEASTVFADRKYLHAAVAAAEFIHDQLIDSNGELLRRYRNRQAGIKAGLGDYAWYIHGLIGLYRVSNDRQWLDAALELSMQQDALFLDGAGGGYFDAYGGNTGLLFRGKTIVDHALPAANAVVLSNLNTLFEYTGDKRWKNHGGQLLSAFAATINNSPQASAMALWAMAKK